MLQNERTQRYELKRSLEKIFDEIYQIIQAFLEGAVVNAFLELKGLTKKYFSFVISP